MARAPSKPAPAKRKPATAPRGSKSSRQAPVTGQVLQELKSLAKELNKAAKGLGKAHSADPKVVSSILANVERMTAEAANKSLQEAESAQQILATARDALGKDWSRNQIESALHGVGGHLTNIIVAQEFQDLAGQAIRKAMKALVGAIVVEANAADDKKLSQSEVDGLLQDLMP
jgi:chemotaxis regulatin CheY-phosphate phosphatase CheZ